ncbi:DedA family protein [Streptomyces sp. NPDC007095]|jgi:membrane-associated protein|uniref:DedA family protein n=1 Tax=Streptomyces sp. NPDC007095 TaxID=3154482 RepID=UPI000CC08FB2
MPSHLWAAAPHTAALALNPLDTTSLLTGLGALGVFAVLFAETGLLIGFFLPGDSLLFTAGLLCTTTTGGVRLSLPAVLAAAVAGALLGAQTGYLIGRRAGRPLLERSRNPHLTRGAARAEELLARYGHGKAVVLARFVPVVRTVLNPLAGALGVPARTFTAWQVAGGLLWSLGVTLAGYLLGSTVPSVDKYLLPAVALMVVVSLIPVVLELRRHRRSAAASPQPPGPVV